jgi:probable phosphoglycerate mutase
METERQIVLVRHGETEWSKSGKHTGRTDVPLTEEGRSVATGLGPQLSAFHFSRVLCSPLSRAKETCALAGFGEKAEMRDELMEWDYGDYEGKLTVDIRKSVPGWTVFASGCPNGETGVQVAQRVEKVIADVVASEGNIAIFAHGHVLRVLTARWLGLGPEGGRYFALETGKVCILSWERETRIIRRWNA